MTYFRSNIAIALGGNLPFSTFLPQETLIRAIRRISLSGVTIRSVSRFFATPCFPAGAGPDYVNAVILVETILDPPKLLAQLHAIEHEFGRARSQRWGMRTLDLDVLAFGQTILPDLATQKHWQALPSPEQIKTTPDQFILPHPRLQDRAFVLVPLNDVAPGWVHPVLNKTVSEMCHDLPQSELEGVRPL